MEPPAPEDPYQSFLLATEPNVALWALPLAGAAILIWTLVAAAYQSAFFSLSPRQINTIYDEHDTTGRYQLVHRFMQQPTVLYSTLHLAQVLGILAWLGFSVAVCISVCKPYGWFSQSWLPVVGVAVGLFLYLGIETWARVWAAVHQLTFLVRTSAWVQLLVYLLFPMAYLYRLGLQLLQRTAPHAVLATGTERLQEAIQQQKEDDSPEEEKTILRALVTLGGITVKSILRARVDVRALDVEATAEEVLEAVNTYGYSRLPVYRDNLDHVEGILYVKDLLPLLGKSGDFQWQQFIRPAYFVPQTKKIQRLLKEFQEKHQHIAIVTDEYGGTAGIVTLQDILEEIFGDIRDEFDRHEVALKQLPDGSYLFDGRTSILDFGKLLGLDEDTLDELRGEGGHESLSGVVLEATGEIPAEGYTTTLGGIHFTVQSATPNAIRQLRVLLPKED